MINELEPRTHLAAVTTLSPQGIRVSAEGGAKLGSLVYFIGKTPELGIELWTTDGTKAGTKLFVDLAKGDVNGVGSSQLFRAGNYLYFAGSDGKQRSGLWRTDGTIAGTVFLNSFSGWEEDSTMLTSTAAFRDRLYFVYKNTLWSSEGTSESTKQIKDLGAIRSNGTPLNLVATSAAVYFWIRGDNDELWRTDGTAKTTRPVATTFGLAWDTKKVIVAGDRLISLGADASGHGGLVSIDSNNVIRLIDERKYDITWGVFDGAAVYGQRFRRNVDGDPEYTVVRNDLKNYTTLYSPGTTSFEPRVVLGGLVMGVRGAAFVSVDTGGAGAYRIRDFENALGADADVEILDTALVGTRVYFSLWDSNQVALPQVWSTDGTSAGTFKLGDVQASLRFKLPPYVGGVDLNGTQIIFTQSAIYAVKPTTSVNGTVFVDANANQKRDAGEAALRGARIYIDLDKDGVYDLGEPTGRSSSSGSFSILDLPSGSYTLRFAPPGAYKSTGPTARSISVTANKTISFTLGAK